MLFLLLATIVLAPAYGLRFHILNFPTNVLMVWVTLLWLVWLARLTQKGKSKQFLDYIKKIDKKILFFVALFFLAGLVGLFAQGFDQKKLGQFLVLFLQPVSLFFLAGLYFSQNPKDKTKLFNLLYVLLAAAGLYALVQYFTLLGLPPAWWGNSQEPKRALSFFAHPNFYALWSAPLLAFLLPNLGEKIRNKNYFLGILWLLGAAGLLLSLSRAGWLGLAAAVAIYFVAAADKKIRQIIFGAVIVMVMVIVTVPNLRYRVLLPFYGEKSASSRIELWQSGWTAIKHSPLLGLGLNGYANNYRRLQTDSSLPEHNFPHNIFLDFWVETGLLGLLSFIGLAGFYIYQGFKNRHHIIKLGAALFLVALIAQGLIDNPYFKNDLALMFWLVLALTI